MFAVCCFPALVIVMSGYTQRQEFGELEKADLTFQHHHHYMWHCWIQLPITCACYYYLLPVPAITTTNLFIPSNLNSLLFSPAWQKRHSIKYTGQYITIPLVHEIILYTHHLKLFSLCVSHSFFHSFYFTTKKVSPYPPSAQTQGRKTLLHFIQAT